MFNEWQVFHPLHCRLGSTRYFGTFPFPSVTSCICTRNTAVAVHGASNGLLISGLGTRLEVVEERAKCNNQANVEQHEVLSLHCNVVVDTCWSLAWTARATKVSRRPEKARTKRDRWEKNDHCQSRTGTLLLITTGRSSSRSLVNWICELGVGGYC